MGRSEDGAGATGGAGAGFTCVNTNGGVGEAAPARVDGPG